LNHLQHNREIQILVFAGIVFTLIAGFSLQPAEAENNIRQIVKISETYPADVASASFPIDPPLVNISKAFVFITYSHVSEADHSDTFKLVRILDVNTLQIVGEDTATGNNAVDFIAYVVEFDNNSDLEVQHLEEVVDSLTTSPESFTIPNAINTTNSFIISRNHAHNASETSIGSEEFERIRITSSTAWEYQVAQDVNTDPQTQAVSIIDWNQADIRTVRGIFTLVAEAGSQTHTETPPSSVDPTRTILIVTYDNDEGQSIDTDDLMLRATLTDSGNIFLERADAEGNIDVAYELIEFPADFARVTHFNSTIPDTDLLLDVVVPEVQDFSKTMAFSTVNAPFGFSGGMHDECCEIPDAIDKVQATFLVTNNTRVQINRDDSVGSATYGWQLIEFLEKETAQPAQGTNTPKQIIKIEGEYTGATVVQDFTIPSVDVSKSILFMTISNDNADTEDVAERMKRWGLIDSTTLRVHGSNDPNTTNLPMNFSATVIEFNSTSPITVQRDQVQYAHGIESDELIMHMNPVNETGSNIFYNSWTSSFADMTLGAEEFNTVRIINGSTWGYDVEIPSDNQESVAIVNIVDWNSNLISVQRGQDTLSGTTLSVSPISDVQRNQTLLLATFRTTNAELSDEPDDAGLFAHLDNSVPPNIVFEREDGTDAGLLINWELISFPDTLINIHHGIHNQTATVSNSTSTIPTVGNLTNAFAIGTVGTPMGYASGKGSHNTTDAFGEISAKMTLDDASTVRFERGLSAGSFDVGFQIVEFFLAPVDTFCESCLNVTGTTFEPTPPSELDLRIFHQLIEWFEPSNPPLEGAIIDLESPPEKIYEILLRMHNGTYGVDGNMTASAEFFEDEYLNPTHTKLADFIGNITNAVRTHFGAPPI
jgi:hypothetical protein